MAKLISSFISSLNPVQQQNPISKFFHHNNAAIGEYCNLIPIIQPSFISTSFGQSVITLSILLIYFTLYQLSATRTEVESRLLTSLIIGNVIFSLLVFNDWFNLKYSVVFCNDYKNGAINLYQVGELVETYRLSNLIITHLKVVRFYLNLIRRQFFNTFIGSFRSTSESISNFVIGGYKELTDLLHELKAKRS